MSWLAGTAQRLRRVFNIDVTECEKCQRHNVSIIACITGLVAQAQLSLVIIHDGCHDALCRVNQYPPFTTAEFERADITVFAAEIPDLLV
jgi:hypothetical protein